MPKNLSGVFQVVPVKFDTGPFESKAVGIDIRLKDGQLILDAPVTASQEP